MEEVHDILQDNCFHNRNRGISEVLEFTGKSLESPYFVAKT
jgi:hypothetical protein